MKWLKEHASAALAITLLRVYVGWQWITSGWHKWMDGFDAGGFLSNAVAKPVIDRESNEALFPNYISFLEHFALPNVEIFNSLIPLGEFLIGVGLIVGGLTIAAAFFGMMLNFLFLFAGSVSANPWLLLLGMIVFMTGANAGRFGLDYYLMPLLRKGWPRAKLREAKEKRVAI